MNKPIRVLVVEDNEDDALLLLRTLRKSGYDPEYTRVDNAPDMREALRHPWDCVISDYSMPKFSALSALEMLRESGQDLPCFIVSGTISEDMAVAAMRAGAHDYLMKGNLQRLGPAIDRELQEATYRAQRRQADIARQESEERFRSTFNQAAVGIGHVSPQGKWLIVNQKLCAILGYAESELLAASLPDVVHASDREAYDANANCLLAGEGDTYSLETRMLRKNGAEVWGELTVSLVRAESGEPKYFIAVIEDISARKAAEDALKRSREELETLNVRLKRAMAETHHRVKNNLQVISALVELQMQDGEEFVPASALARVGQHTRALALLHDLLTSEAKGDAEMDTVSARAALNKLIPIIQATMGDRKIHYDNVADVALPVKIGASMALLVNELLSNAVKHGKGDIDVALTTEGETVCLEVCDDGPGFPPGFDSATAANTGLELVESIGRWDLGGQVAYETRPEGGARVRVTFSLQSS